MPDTVALDASTDAEFDRLASATGRSKLEGVDAALRSYIASESEFLAAVEEGKEDLRQGRIIDHADVVAAFNRMIGSKH
jgi:predicted transcriptional regulator